MSAYFCDVKNSLRIGFSASACNVFALHQQLHFWQFERGGVLLASSVGSTDGVVDIVEVTAPHRDDRAGPYSLKLDHARVLREINEGFERGLHFVGYWHTHPQRRPRLSPQDAIAMKPALQGSGLDLSRILMVVVGGRRGAVELDVCAVECATGTMERLARVPPAVGHRPSTQQDEGARS